MRNRLELYLSEIETHLRRMPDERRVEQMRELREHLLSTVSALTGAGLSDEEAEAAAVQRFGPAVVVGKGLAEMEAVARRRELTAHLARVLGLINPNVKQRLVALVSSVAVVFTAGWLVFVALQIRDILSPNSGLFIPMKPGIHLTMDEHGATVGATGHVHGAIAYDVDPHLLITAIVVPFAVLALFALVGCWSLCARARVKG